MRALPFASDDRRDGVVGLSYAMRQIAQLLLMCDGHDIGVSIGPATELADADAPQPAAVPAVGVGASVQDGDEPRVFIYDNYPGGIGFSEPLFRMHATARAHARADRRVPVRDRVPGVRRPARRCRPGAKAVALEILARLG